MTSKSEKEKRKEILRDLRNKEREIFIGSLPADKQVFLDLFDYLENNIEECDHKMTLTLDFLKEKKAEDIDNIIKWLNDKGGYCDCEVLFNVVEQFE